MSRVSDAFRRAAEEGAQGVAEPTKRLVTPLPEKRTVDGMIERRVERPAATPSIAEQPVTVGHGKNGNGSARFHPAKSPVPSSELHAGGVLGAESSLRTWFQQVFFGRDLSHVDPYPLIALDKNSQAGEQYKILREQLNKAIADRSYRFFAITSPIKGDGKTTVAANLAAAMALHRDKGVLLIDADLRNPSLHRCFGISSSPGLADYLTGSDESELVDYFQETAIAGLRILPAGKSRSDSAELLASERMRTLIQEIANEFPNDQVILDTSPVLSTSDPLVLCRQLDGLVMVVRAGKTPRECLSEALKLIGPEKVIGLVLNGAELGSSARYYYYYGQQS